MSATSTASSLPEACDFTVFGGTGDLALRKLLPALYLRDREGHLPDDTRIIGVSRSPLDDDGYRAEVREALTTYVAPDLLDEPSVTRMLGRLHHLTLDAASADDWHRLHGLLKDRPRHDETVRVFYLAVAPKLFGAICQRLDEIGAVDANARVVMEKPVGHDLASARAVNDDVGRVFAEQQIFRIDHYLGKESVQNLLVTRFANTFLEPLWNSRWVDHVQITVAESLGVGERGDYYDHSGALRDMVQNHLLQLLCLVAMEPPTLRRPRDRPRREAQGAPGAQADGARRRRPRHRPGPVRRRAGRRRGRAVVRRRPRARRATPRRSWRCGPRCRTGAGPGCRSTCAPASAWTAGSRRSWWSSRSRRTRCSRTARASRRPTGCTSRSSPTRACACT